MLTLMLKDLLIQRRNLLFVAFYPIFMFIAFSDIGYQTLVYTMGTVMMTYILLSNVLTIEDNGRAHIFLNSLPITRLQIVASRYISVVVFSTFGFTMMVIMGSILRPVFPLPIPYPTITGLGTAVAVSLAAACLYYPLNVLLGSIGARTAGILIFLAAFFLPGVFQGYAENNPAFMALVQKIAATPPYSRLALVLAAIASLLAISFAISIYLYNRKDFS